jgi:hypothetical protein
VFDKGFPAAEILRGLTMNGRNRHFLIPAKSNTCCEVIPGTDEGAMVRMRVSPGFFCHLLLSFAGIMPGSDIPFSEFPGRLYSRS